MDLSGTFAGSTLRSTRIVFDETARRWRWKIVTADGREHTGRTFADQASAARNLVLSLTTRRSAKPEAETAPRVTANWTTHGRAAG